MIPDEILNEINKLDLSEKIILVEDIWDSIGRSQNSLPLQEWQKKELDLRYKEYKKGNASLHDWDEVHETLRQKYK